jgi:hypothetical protein
MLEQDPYLVATWSARRPRPEQCFSSLTFSLQALLVRHEAYMASAERERLELAARIEQLESEKATLEDKNRRTIDENRQLLDQLEQLNTSVRDSDDHVAALETTLRDSQLEIRRLEASTQRAEDMERHIFLLEEEQDRLRGTLTSSQSETRTAMLRWKQAERGLIDLQEQLEHMEREARDEHERHIEVLQRMERQRALEKDLDAAAGRLKGAAMTKAMGADTKKAGDSVVSHFVRDLIQDNLGLQSAITELRNLLMNSNDEIQLLREQLQFHQPHWAEDGGGGGEQTSATSTLRAELESKEPPQTPIMSQELHIHHHYHVVNKPETKKPKKKRLGLSPSVFTPPQLASPALSATTSWQIAPVSPVPRGRSHHASNPSTSTVSGPSEHPRWSLFSENPSDFAPSSVPSSPQSNPRNSMFERQLFDMSNPGSPTTSVDPLSPTWRGHNKRPSQMSVFGFPPSPVSQPKLSKHHSSSSATHPHPLTNMMHEGDIASPEVADRRQDGAYMTDDLPDLTRTVPTTDESTIDTASDSEASLPSSPLPAVSSPFDPTPRGRSLRHVVSHESIISLSNGLDIHTLKTRPSQLSLRPLGLTAAGTNLSDATASATIARGNGQRTSMLLRDSLGSNAIGLGLPLPRVREARVVSTPTSSPGTARIPSVAAFGRFVSWRPWASPNTNVDTSGTPPMISVPDPNTSTSPTISDGTPTPTATPTITISTSSSLGALKAAPTTATTTQPPSPALSHHSARSSSSGSQLQTSNGNAKLSAVGSYTPVPVGTPRASGINQPGAIPGFQEYWAMHQRRGPPSRVSPDPGTIDREALREILEEG